MPDFIAINPLSRDIQRLLKQHKAQNIVFVCIGTDRSTGDSYGPLIGSRLAALGYEVIGTIDETCNATNLDECIARIPPDSFVIAVDACLGQLSSIGKVRVEDGPLNPGAGVEKELTPVGDIHIAGIVNVGGFMEYLVLQNTRLSIVLKMVETTVAAIQKAIPAPAAIAEVATTTTLSKRWAKSVRSKIASLMRRKAR